MTTARGRGALPGEALALALGPVLIFSLIHVASPIDRKVAVIPDDGLYYLLLGRNFAERGVWSFDGVTRTGGFHLAQAYTSALVSWALPAARVETLLTVLGWVGIAVTALAIVLLARTFTRMFSPRAAVGVAFVAGSANFLQQSVSAMEWPWVVLASALLLDAVLEDRPGLAFFAGCLGTLGRTDFPLVAGAAACASVLLRLHGRRLPHARAVGLGLAGAVVALGAALLHNHAFTGEFLQSSARIKAHWGSVRGYMPSLGAEIIVWASAPGEALGRGYKFVLAAHALVACALAVLERSAPAPHGPPPDERRREGRRFVAVFGVLAAALLAAFYARGSASIQAWYTSPFVVPVAGLYAVGIDRLERRLSLWIVRLALAAALAVNLWLAAHGGIASQAWNMRGGEWLGQHRPAGWVGAWNAGLISAFSTGDVINLDGLVNDSVVPYVLDDRLHCYLLAAHIDHVFDWEQMLGDELARMGGYPSGLLKRALVPRYVVPGTEGFPGRLTLFEVDRTLLEAEGGCR
jgi:hypothetical protein